MIQDPSDQQIKAINALFDLTGKDVLEIGCGKGRITRDLAKFARHVVAADPDSAALQHARSAVPSNNVEFISAPNGIPPLQKNSIDLAIYSLSLHHVPADKMKNSLTTVGKLLKKGGAIMVLEPGDGGTFNAAKRRFGVGSGNEDKVKEAAIQSMQDLPGWAMSETYCFEAQFLFADREDFFRSKLPNYRQLQPAKQRQIEDFLLQYKTNVGIILTTERRLNLLQKTTDG